MANPDIMTARGAAWLQAPFGPVRVLADGKGIRRVELWPDEAFREEPGHPLADRAARALERWLWGEGPWPRGWPLMPAGTPFQRRVWRALQEIVPGQRLTYGELAARLGTSARAVGGACRANPLPLLVPCHRVVAAHGLGGFAGDREGARLEVKRWLLEHE